MFGDSTVIKTIKIPICLIERGIISILLLLFLLRVSYLQSGTRDFEWGSIADLNRTIILMFAHAHCVVYFFQLAHGRHRISP